MFSDDKYEWRVEIHNRFQKKLARLARPERETILHVLNNLQSNPFAFDLKPLRGRTDWRLKGRRLENSIEDRCYREGYCGI